MAYLRIALLFGLGFLLNAVAPDVLARFQVLAETEFLLATSFWCVGLIFFFGWAASEAAESTLLPNFAIQLLLGIVLHDAFAPLAAQPSVCVVLCTAMAAIILKSGGDGIELKALSKLPLIGVDQFAEAGLSEVAQVGNGSLLVIGSELQQDFWPTHPKDSQRIRCQRHWLGSRFVANSRRQRSCHLLWRSQIKTQRKTGASY